MYQNLTELFPKSSEHDVGLALQHDQLAAKLLELIVQVIQSFQEVPHTIVADYLGTCSTIIRHMSFWSSYGPQDARIGRKLDTRTL